MDESKCKEKVYPKEQWGSFHGHQCHRKIWKDGFCKQHHPDTVKEKSKIKQEQWDEENKQQGEVWRRDRAMRLACEDVSTEILEKIKVKELLDSAHSDHTLEGK